MRLSKTLLVGAILLHFAHAVAQAQSFTDLSRYLPRDANALVVVNAEALYQSPLGQRENWRQTFHDFSRATPLLIPPSAQQAVLASHLDINMLTPDWEAAALRLSVDPSINEIADRLGGALDKLAAMDAVWLGGKTCVVKFAPQTVALLTPVTRQEAGRWLTGVTSPNPMPLSPYLHEALTHAEAGGPQIVMAVDMVDALPAALIGAVAEQSEILAKARGVQATTLMSGLQGVKFAVKVDEQMHGTLQIDFTAETAALAPVAKPLMLAILREAGAMLEEFNDWQAEAAGNSLVLSGELTPAGLRRVLSLLAVDASALGHAPAETPPQTTTVAEAAPPQPKKDPTVVASQRYFRAVGQYIGDAQRLNRADSLRQSVMWLQNYARRVENLSTRYVDPELAQYGQHVAQTFRNVINEAYGIADKQAAIESLSGPTEVKEGLLPYNRISVPGYRFYEYAPFYSATYNAQQQQQAAAEQKKLQDQIYAQVEQARQTLTQLVADHETVRSKLSQRYGVQFR